MFRTGLARSIIAALALALVVGPTGTARADIALAKAAFKRAQGEFAAGDFTKALASYQAAYNAKPLAGFHFNIAQCHRNLGDHQQAIVHYEKYLAKSRNPQLSAEATQLLEQSRAALEEQRAAAETVAV